MTCWQTRVSFRDNISKHSTDSWPGCRPYADVGRFDQQSPRSGGCQADVEEGAEVYRQEAEEVDGADGCCVTCIRAGLIVHRALYELLYDTGFSLQLFNPSFQPPSWLLPVRFLQQAPTEAYRADPARPRDLPAILVSNERTRPHSYPADFRRECC